MDQTRVFSGKAHSLYDAIDLLRQTDVPIADARCTGSTLLLRIAVEGGRGKFGEGKFFTREDELIDLTVSTLPDTWRWGVGILGTGLRFVGCILLGPRFWPRAFLRKLFA
jgi:hypothetical protein